MKTTLRFTILRFEYERKTNKTGGRGKKSRKRVHGASTRNKTLCSISRGVEETSGKIERAF